VSADRPKHQDKDLEKLLVGVEERGWRVTKGRKYFRCFCPCGDHMETVHLTPSSGRYLINTTKKFERTPCWKGEAK
jgi:hypothetical protein